MEPSESTRRDALRAARQPCATPVPHSQAAPRVAVITMGVKLGAETKGYTRFLTIAEQLAGAGLSVELITSSFQHWEKAHRDTAAAEYRAYPFDVSFIDEPGYKRNIDLSRVRSHRRAASALHSHLQSQHKACGYDLVYCEIPPNDVARAAAEFASAAGIPFVVDVNDLWPEAMRMVLDVPVISQLLYRPLARDAKATYRRCSAVVGTSDEYAERPFADCAPETTRLTVYVGGNKEEFDAGAALGRAAAQKPAGAFWVTYAGTLGTSYDLETLINASVLAQQHGVASLELLLIGDGPDLAKLERHVQKQGAPVRFLGYQDYSKLADWLVASDVVVNSLVRKAPQSIVNKVGDYLFSGRPMINTGLKTELRNLVTQEKVGLNVVPGDPGLLAAAIERLASDAELRALMGANARRLAVERFDRARSYAPIVELVMGLVARR
ncbi:MAG: glycosyltransferase family 4 protein [Coriobacteriales bacterium]|nr:glycosyltransferase family 4 protein [Coriobacteriales bacterium]